MMEAKKSVSLFAALLAFAIAGPTAALASDSSDSEHGDGPAASATAPATGENEAADDANGACDKQESADDANEAAEEQQSDEQGDVQNTDLAAEVEQADGNDQCDVNDEQEVGDGADGQVED